MYIYLLIIVAVAIVIFIAVQKNELSKFTVTHYRITNSKINHSLCIALISDLHGYSYGTNNKNLLNAVFMENPDFVLIPGDIVTYEDGFDFDKAAAFINALSKKYPVFYTNGNHESRFEEEDEDNDGFYDFIEEIRCKNLHRLNNEYGHLLIKENNIKIFGLELDRSYYKRFSNAKLGVNKISDLIGLPDRSKFNIVLAHNPAFTDKYMDWGADLSVSGHDHGGLVRFPGIGSIISPQFKLFPKYDGGLYKFGKKSAVVSRGLGTHRYNIRINNRAELIFIHVSNS